MNLRSALVGLVVAGASSTFASLAAAQTPPAAAPAPAPADGAAPATPPADPNQAVVRNEGGRRVYVASGTIEIRGELQRPMAFTLSGRSTLGYSYFDQPARFVDEILAVVRRGAPF